VKLMALKYAICDMFLVHLQYGDREVEFKCLTSLSTNQIISVRFVTILHASSAACQIRDGF